MDKNDIIRMAREAGAGEWGDSVIPAMMDIERFAKLVAAAEREACAQVCETEGIGAKYQGDVYAVAIRARGQA